MALCREWQDRIKQALRPEGRTNTGAGKGTEWNGIYVFGQIWTLLIARPELEEALEHSEGIRRSLDYCTAFATWAD